MSINIDWSKAPRATHYLNAGDPMTRFRDCSGENWAFFNQREGAWREYFMPSAKLVARPDCIARHQAWNGEGLPPVGTEVDVNHGPGIWDLVRIVAHHGDRAIYVDPYGGIHYLYGTPGDFRPARTPEQIAADSHKERCMQKLNALWDADTRREEFLSAVYAMILEEKP